MSTNQKITSFGSVFDATKIAPAQPMEAVPAGWYSVIVSDAEIKANDGGNGRRLALEFTVTEGGFKGRKIWDGLNIVHSNPQAQEIACQQFSAICHAIAVYQVSDASQIVNKPFQIKVDVENERWVNDDNETVEPNTPGAKKYESKNRFKGAKAGSAPATVAKPGAPAPAWSAPAKTATPAPTPPPWAATAAAPVGNATPSPAPVAEPATTVAPTPVASVASPSEKPKGKPGRKPNVNPAAKAERMFFVDLEGSEYENALPESKIADLLLKGMPVETPIVLDGETDYKTASEYKIQYTAAANVAVAPPAPVATAPGGLPPWAK